MGIKKKLYYIASPYTHDDENIQEERFKLVCALAAKMMNDDKVVFSPIAHCHPLATMFGLPKDWAFWQNYDVIMLSRCDVMIVYMLDGWKDSTGVQAEIKIAEGLGIPIEYVDPKIV